MNTQTISQFEPLDTELLATVEGGKNEWACILSVAALGTAGTIYGSPLAGAAMAGMAARVYCQFRRNL